LKEHLSDVVSGSFDKHKVVPETTVVKTVRRPAGENVPISATDGRATLLLSREKLGRSFALLVKTILPLALQTE
jgi:hypothetical protein